MPSLLHHHCPPSPLQHNWKRSCECEEPLWSLLALPLVVCVPELEGKKRQIFIEQCQVSEWVSVCVCVCVCERE